MKQIAGVLSVSCIIYYYYIDVNLLKRSIIKRRNTQCKDFFIPGVTLHSLDCSWEDVVENDLLNLIILIHPGMIAYLLEKLNISSLKFETKTLRDFTITI